jgi:hypothetical protein
MHAIYNLQSTITHSILGLEILFFESLNSFIPLQVPSTRNSVQVFSLGAQSLDRRILTSSPPENPLDSD